MLKNKKHFVKVLLKSFHLSGHSTGYCFHLFTQHRAEALEDYQLPEMMRTPLEELCLQIKVIRLDLFESFFPSLKTENFFSVFKKIRMHTSVSLRSRRLEVVGTRKKGRARRRRACLPRARPFCLSPTTSKCLLRGLT